MQHFPFKTIGNRQVKRRCAEFEVFNPANEEEIVVVNEILELTITPGVMTLSNGDPGYPDDYDEETIEVLFFNLEGERINRPEWLTDKLYNAAVPA